jgi:hypothetical protein
MRRATILFLAAVVLPVLSATTVSAKSASELLREGLYAEEVEGNLDTAIGIYQQIIPDTTAPKNLVAQALYRQGMCCLKKKDEAKAREVFLKLVNDYADQTEVVEKVRPLIEELGNADPASLMPPETIAYIEIGNPGRQVATILKMLKGTPLENPLSLLGQQAGPQGAAAGGKNPMQVINALFNPSMLAELEKIRGVGVGILDTAGKNPPALVVLYPGKSEALKGLMQMGLTALGTPAEPLEGMNLVLFRDGGGAAFDGTVVILASPSAKAKDVLQWSVRQYKGRGHEPTLASANPSFSKISRQTRQQNALTLWLNIDETYARVLKTLPADKIPPQLQMLDSMVALKDIDDVIASLSLRETGMALDANLGLKTGYQSLAYGVIHTPNLNKASLQAVPAGAVALLSLTLGSAGTPQAMVIGGKIKEATGLDLGPQIFGNIEQITVFAVPPKEALSPEGEGIPPIARALGIAVTSRNLQQTQQLLTSVLQMTNTIAPETQIALPATGRYEVPLALGLKLFGYTNEASRRMVLSLNSQLVEESVVAAQADKSVLSGGVLQDALATLPPTTSKLLAVNVAGTLQLAQQNVHFPSPEVAGQVREALAAVIQATEKTTLRLQTNEAPDGFGIRLSVSDLPPLKDVIVPIGKLGEMFKEQAHAISTKAQGPAPISIPPTTVAPAIDGNMDEAWKAAPAQEIGHAVYAAPASAADLSATFRTLHDRQALYLLVEVADDRLVSDSTENWLDDGVEVFVDADNSKAGVYDDNDYQYHFDWDDTAPALGETRHNNTNGVQYAFARTDRGYRLEIKLPWSALGTAPAVGNRIGLDVHVNDDDDGGDRDTKIIWFGTHDVAWQQPRTFGTAELAGLVGWWKLDESEGTKAADSSGNRHHATVRGGAQWQPSGGKLGGAIALSGNADHLEVADEVAFDCTAGVTVAAWIKPNALDKPWQAIVTKGEGAWRLQRNNEASTLEFACTGLQIPGGNEYGSLFGTREIAPGEWHHVAGVYDGRQMYLYVDGALDRSQEASGPINTDDNPVLIGENGQIAGRFWNGLIDDVRVYNFGLGQAQIQEIQTATK